MKFAKARIGEKFVFPDRGGLWQKMSAGEARMVFPDKGRPCCDIDPNLEVYVIFERNGSGTHHAMRLVMVDRQTEETVLDVPDASAHQMAALAESDEVRMTPKGKRKQREYVIDEMVTDWDVQTLFVSGRDVTGKTGNEIEEV